MRRAIATFLVCAAIAGSSFAEDEPVKAVEPPDAAAEDLLDRAAEASPEDYVLLREQCLESSCIDRLKRKDLDRVADWKEEVIAKAWLEWAKNPEECKRLWDYEPPPNFYRNPFPLLWEESYRTFSAAGATGLVVAQELMFVRCHSLYGALASLLAEDRSWGSNWIILECSVKTSGLALSEALKSLGPDWAPVIHSRLDEATDSSFPQLVNALAHFQYTEAMPELGDRLFSFGKSPYGTAYKYPTHSITGYRYAHSHLALAIVRFFEIAGGPRFPRAGDAHSTAVRIDAAKEWWKINAGRYPRPEPMDMEEDEATLPASKNNPSEVRLWVRGNLNPERYRVLADFNGDGHEDLALSDSLSLFGMGGIRFSVYLNDGNERYVKIGETFCHPRHMVVEQHPSHPRLWVFRKKYNEVGLVGYHEIRGQRLMEFEGIEISLVDGGTEIGNAILEAMLQNSDTVMRAQVSTTIDGQVHWGEIP